MENHLWKNRVLVIFTEDKNNVDFQKQLLLFKKSWEEMENRKLIIYSFTAQ